MRQLVSAAQQGRAGEVEQLLEEWALALGALPGDIAHLAGGEMEHSPGSASPRQHRAPASLEEGAADEGQQAAAQPPAGPGQQVGAGQGSGSSGSGGSGGGADLVDVRRWQYDYSSLQKLRPLGKGSFGEVRWCCF